MPDTLRFPNPRPPLGSRPPIQRRWNRVDMPSPLCPRNALACPWPHRGRSAPLKNPSRPPCFHRLGIALDSYGFPRRRSVLQDGGCHLPPSITASCSAYPLRRAFTFHGGGCNTVVGIGGIPLLRASWVVSPSRGESSFNNGRNTVLGDGGISLITASWVSLSKRESEFNGHKRVLGDGGILSTRYSRVSPLRSKFGFDGHNMVLGDRGIPSRRASTASLSRRTFGFNVRNTNLGSGGLPFIKASRVSRLRKTFSFNGFSIVLGDGGCLSSRRRKSKFNGHNTVLDNGTLPSRRESKISLLRRSLRFNGRLGLQLSRRRSRFHCRRIVSPDSYLLSLKPEVLLSPHSLTLDISYIPSSSSSRAVFAFSEETRFILHNRPGGCLMSHRLNAQSEQPPMPSKPGWFRKFLIQPIPYNSYLGDSDEIEDAVENLSADLIEEEPMDAFDEFNNEDVMDPPPPPPPPPRSPPPKDRFRYEANERSKFDAWKRRQEAISELRKNQQSGRSSDNKDWEDWLDDRWEDKTYTMGPKGGSWYYSQSEWEKGGLPRNPPKMPERGMNRTIKELLLRIFEKQEEVEDDLQFEERVFRFTSQSTAKFVAVLILVPWLVGYLTHDYAIVPFLNRYVEKVPLAASVLDLRESQKLGMIKSLKLERQRVRFEAAIGMAPPLSDEELAEHIQHEAFVSSENSDLMKVLFFVILVDMQIFGFSSKWWPAVALHEYTLRGRELQEELRLENRRAFANIWSDLLAGATLLMLLVFNPNQVAIMRITGDRLFTNVSDTGKAFIIILLSDIFLGYHSESGWETLVDIVLEHYGFEVSRASIYIFVAIVPVTIDAIFKLWVFRYLTRLSPSAAATFREMKRH